VTQGLPFDSITKGGSIDPVRIGSINIQIIIQTSSRLWNW